MRTAVHMWRWCPNCAAYWPARGRRQWCLVCHELLIDRSPIEAPAVLPLARVRAAIGIRRELLAIAAKLLWQPARGDR